MEGLKNQIIGLSAQVRQGEFKQPCGFRASHGMRLGRSRLRRACGAPLGPSAARRLAETHSARRQERGALLARPAPAAGHPGAAAHRPQGLRAAAGPEPRRAGGRAGGAGPRAALAGLPLPAVSSAACGRCCGRMWMGGGGGAAAVLWVAAGALRGVGGGGGAAGCGWRWGRHGRVWRCERCGGVGAVVVLFSGGGRRRPRGCARFVP
jgi:hypothetical protein